jgi:hypothetical protein
VEGKRWRGGGDEEVERGEGSEEENVWTGLEKKRCRKRDGAGETDAWRRRGGGGDEEYVYIVLGSKVQKLSAMGKNVCNGLVLNCEILEWDMALAKVSTTRSSTIVYHALSYLTTF